MYDFASAGDKGVGVFATEDIPCGTRVLSDHPLFVLDRCTTLNIYKAFLRLPKTQQQQYLALTHWDGTLLRRQNNNGAESSRAFTSDHNSEMQETVKLQQYAEELTATNVGTDAIPSLDLEEGAKVVAIFNTNSFGCNAIENGAGIFLKPSRLNHSCLPNAIFDWNDLLGELTIHAQRDIAAGEEVTIPYVGLLQSRVVRRSQLQRNWGFCCRCRACELADGPSRIASCERRIRLGELNGRVPTYWGKGMARPSWDGTCTEILKLLEEEGLRGWEMGKTYVYRALCWFDACYSNHSVRQALQTRQDPKRPWEASRGSRADGFGFGFRNGLLRPGFWNDSRSRRKTRSLRETR